MKTVAHAILSLTRIYRSLALWRSAPALVLYRCGCTYRVTLKCSAEERYKYTTLHIAAHSPITATGRGLGDHVTIAVQHTTRQPPRRV